MAVLKRTELEESPLADLHAVASELGLEGFRGMRRSDLIGAILGAEGAPEPAEEDEREAPSDETPEAPSGDGSLEDVAEEDEVAAEGDEPGEEDEPEGEGEAEDAEDEESDTSAADARDEEESVAGVLDILSNGSGFLRMEPTGQSRGDVYVSPAQIRRCELRAGDDVSGPARPPRRNERHPSLVRVESVNGAPAEPPEERPSFADLTPVFASERVSGSAALEAVPFGRGSRVSVGGPSGAGATTLLRELAGAIAAQYPDMSVQVVLAGVRPEEVAEWREGAATVVGGSFERSPDAHAQAAELAVERAKRQVERGGHAAIVVDSLEGLPPGVRRRVFGAGRATEEGGTLTVVAAIGEDREAARWATTRVVLEVGGRVSESESATLRSDRLA